MDAPLDWVEYDRWQEQAASARVAAEGAASVEAHGWACFLYEQSAQLSLKGLLHAAGLEGWGHDVMVLCERAEGGLTAGWGPEVVEAAARLARHYIPSRYPDAVPAGPPASHYTLADARSARSDCELVVGAVDGVARGLRGEP